MGTSEILWACRRRWRVIVVAIALGLAIGWLTTPSSSSVARKHAQEISYSATNTVVTDGSTDVNLDRLALVETAGQVPANVRKMFRERPDAGNDATGASANGIRRVTIGK